jgi:chitin synthase
MKFCNGRGQGDAVIPDITKKYQVEWTRSGDPLYRDYTETEQVAWVWALIFAFCIPEVGSLFRALRIVLFKTWAAPRFSHFAFVALMECCSAAGTAMLVFLALPEMDSSHALALTNCVAFVPSVLLLMSRTQRDKHRWWKLPLDVLAVLVQLSGMLVWPVLQWAAPDQMNRPLEYPWAITVGLLLTSCGWWECFITEESE